MHVCSLARPACLPCMSGLFLSVMYVCRDQGRPPPPSTCYVVGGESLEGRSLFLCLTRPPLPPKSLGLDFWSRPGTGGLFRLWSSEWCLVLMAGERLRRSGSERYCPPASSSVSSPGFRCGVGVGSRDGSGAGVGGGVFWFWSGCVLLVWSVLAGVEVGWGRVCRGQGRGVVVVQCCCCHVWSECWPTSDTTHRSAGSSSSFGSHYVLHELWCVSMFDVFQPRSLTSVRLEADEPGLSRYVTARRGTPCRRAGGLAKLS